MSIIQKIAEIFNPAPQGVFAGKVVAFTGTLQHGNRKMQRAEAQKIVKSHGGDIVIGESGKLRNANLLVLGTQAAGRSKSQKMDRAAESNVPTITAEQFFRMIGH
jgi:NAD-dependent DNA ligase